MLQMHLRIAAALKLPISTVTASAPALILVLLDPQPVAAHQSAALQLLRLLRLQQSLDGCFQPVLLRC
jgi:hypothetical protein